MGSSVFSIGVTGINAAQAGLVTTGHNIVNASTPGYSRQQVVQSTQQPMMTGAGAMGQGTSIVTVKRAYSEYLTNQVLGAQSRSAELDTYFSEIKQIDNLLADPSAGLTPALQEFFRTVQGVATSPNSSPARQALLSGAQALASRFQALDQRLNEMRDGVDTQLVAVVGEINSYATQIANLNARILLVQAAGSNQPANDLLDQRDQIIAELNKQVKVTTSVDSDGSYNVFVGNGQALVVGATAYTLATANDLNDASRLTIAYDNGVSTVRLRESMLTGGALGGLLTFRSATLDSAQSALGRIAIGLAQTFNDQHALGQDLNGDVGGAFFDVPTPNVLTNANNTGTGTVSATIINSDYRVVYDPNNDGSDYTITRLSDNTAVATDVTLPQTVDGVTISLASGSPTAGDAFIVRPGNRDGERVIADSDNDATTPAVLDATDSNVQSLTTSDYRLEYVSLAAGYTLTRLSDNTSWTIAVASLPETIDGVTIDVTAGAAAGDVWLIQPTRLGARDIGLAITDTRDIAAAAPFRTSAASSNTGTAQIDQGSVVSVLPGANGLPLSADITLTYDDTTSTFTVAGATPAVASIAYTSGEQITFNGLAFTITGEPADGDVFTISANTGGVSDNRNALALGVLQTANTLIGGTAGYQTAYSQLVSEVGNKAREVQVSGEAQENLLAQAKAAQQSMAGVNLDEEAANLLRYQQAYQASGKMIEIASKLFDTLLELGR